MSVGFAVKYYWFQVGTGDFLHSFFSTIAYNLENGEWGSKYPTLMNELYRGRLKANHITFAAKELELIYEGLKQFPCEKVVWDIDDLSKQPPWGSDIDSSLTNLSNYFVTSDGESLIDVLRRALKTGLETKSDVCIENM